MDNEANDVNLFLRYWDLQLVAIKFQFNRLWRVACYAHGSWCVILHFNLYIQMIIDEVVWKSAFALLLVAFSTKVIIWRALCLFRGRRAMLHDVPKRNMGVVVGRFMDECRARKVVQVHSVAIPLVDEVLELLGLLWSPLLLAKLVAMWDAISASLRAITRAFHCVLQVDHIRRGDDLVGVRHHACSR